MRFSDIIISNLIFTFKKLRDWQFNNFRAFNLILFEFFWVSGKHQ